MGRKQEGQVFHTAELLICLSKGTVFPIKNKFPSWNIVRHHVHCTYSMNDFLQRKLCFCAESQCHTNV